MRTVKSIFNIILQNYRKWRNDYRIYMIAIVVFMLVWSFWTDLRDVSVHFGEKASPWVFPFLYTQYYTKVIYTIPLIFLFCNAPFKDKNYVFVITRSGRMKWALGEILYIVSASGIYFIYIFALSLLLGIGKCSWNSDWGETLITLAHSSSADILGESRIEVSSIIIDCFSPLQAIWFTFLMSWLCGIFLGLIVFFFNLITNQPFTGGVLAGVFPILSYFIVMGDKARRFVKFSPVSWITMDNIDVGGLTSSPPFSYCLGFLLLSCAVLSVLILLCESRLLYGKFDRN